MTGNSKNVNFTAAIYMWCVARFGTICTPEYHTRGFKYISKISIMSFDKLQFWNTKFTVLIASILTSITLFKSDAAGNVNSFKSSIPTTYKSNVAAEHIVL